MFTLLNPNAQPFTPSPVITPHLLDKLQASPTSTLNAPACNIAHINICSLRHKVDQLHDMIVQNNIHIMAVTETWLDNSIGDTEVSLPGYTLFRRDRDCGDNCSCLSGGMAPCKKYGGVCIYCHNSLHVTPFLDVDTSSHEMLWVQLQGKSSASELLIIGCTYRPPSAPVSYWSTLSTALLPLQGLDVVMLGDLNADFLLNPIPSTSLRHLQTDIMLPLNLQNRIADPTRVTSTSSSSIDCILSNVDSVSDGVVLPSPISDHSLVLARYTEPTAGSFCRTHTRATRNFQQFDLQRFETLLHNSNLMQFSSSDVDSMLEEWECKFVQALDVVAPPVPSRPIPRRHQPKGPTCPFMTTELLQLIEQRKSTYRKFRQTSSKDGALFSQFRKLRTKCNNLYRKLRNEYFTAQCLNFRKSPARLWRVIDQVTRRSAPRNSVQADVNHLSTYFHNITYDSNASCHLPYGPPTQSTFSELSPVDSLEMQLVLESLDANKSPGPDGIYPGLLQSVAAIIAPSLACISSSAFKQGIFPSILKLANITPILKAPKLDKTSPSSYRPVSLTSILAKVMEKLVLSRLRDFWKEDILHDHQFGFRPQRSTGDLLTLAINDWAAQKDKGRSSAVAFVDITKAFDSVKHDELLLSLQGVGISGPALTFFMSYLRGRLQRVVTHQGHSDYLPVNKGVPQGSILGPLLFNIYLRHLPPCMPEAITLLLYADDIALYASHVDCERACSLLTSGLTKLAACLSQIGLTVNSKKTKAMVISRPGHKLKSSPAIFLGPVKISMVDQVRYLGVMVDNSLSFTAHVDSIVSKVGRKIGMLRRAYRKLSQYARRQFLACVISPDFEYCLSSFLTHLSSANRHRLFAMFRRAVRVCCGAGFQDDVVPLLHLLKLQSLEIRYIFLFVMSVYRVQVSTARCLRSLLSPPLASHSYRTRGTAAGHLPVFKYSTKAGINSFHHRATLVWNSLPASLTTCQHVVDFRSNLRFHLQTPLYRQKLSALVFDNVANI